MTKEKNPPVVERFADVIDCWPDVNTMAADIGENQMKIYNWRSRSNTRASIIPADYWVAIMEAAGRRGIAGLSYELFARIVAAGGALPRKTKDLDESVFY